jgi:hypothetical protein
VREVNKTGRKEGTTHTSSELRCSLHKRVASPHRHRTLRP